MRPVLRHMKTASFFSKLGKTRQACGMDATTIFLAYVPSRSFMKTYMPSSRGQRSIVPRLATEMTGQRIARRANLKISLTDHVGIGQFP